MTFTGLLGQSTVSDIDRALTWYTQLFGRGPDAAPMSGLYEWYINPQVGLQVFADSDRAGHSSTVIATADLDEAVSDLDRAGLAHPTIENASAFRIVRLTDPDGNLVVLTGA